MKRRVFYSFHYKPDSWRASMVRNIGVVEGNRPATDNDWETVKKGRDRAIKDWIERQIENRSCTVVLVGANTAGRKWIDYEIIKSWNDGMGVVGIRIHGLKDQDGQVSSQGKNPFSCINFDSAQLLSSVAKCYNPRGSSSEDKYDWIRKYLSEVIEEAISIRKSY